MIALRTLGTIDLVGGDGARIHALLRRPKRLALLAYLATARADATYRREKLLAMFWPEIDEARARGSLRQSIHVLRQLLGTEFVSALGDEELSLSPTLLRCDAVDFERAIREGRLADGVGMYTGDFLPGFFLDGAAEFDEWLESARTRLRELATEAAVNLAEAAWSAGDYEECRVAARRAVAIAPADERAARRLILALDRTGDRGAAVSAYDALAQRLMADLDVLPSAETQALIAAVRARDRARGPAVEISGPSLVAPPLARGVPTSRWGGRFGQRFVRGALLVTVLLLSGSRVRNSSAHLDPAALPAPARDAYSRGRFFLAKPTEANLRKAVLFFEQALDAEPLYAAAYAGLGDAFLRLGYASYLAPLDAFPKAIAAAHRAIELDSLAPEAHATLAFALMYHDWNWTGAEREFRLAEQLAPDYALAHDWHAYLLVATGREGEAEREIAIAQRLAPLSVATAVDAGFVSFYAGDRTQARRRLEAALLMAPDVPLAHFWLGRLNQVEGDQEHARAEFEATGDLRNWVPTIAASAYVEALRGNPAAARMALVRLDSIARSRYVTPYAVALVHTALGQPDEAFHWLDRAVTDRSHWLVWLNRDTRLAPLRGDPRFAAILRRVGLRADN